MLLCFDCKLLMFVAIALAIYPVNSYPANHGKNDQSSSMVEQSSNFETPAVKSKFDGNADLFALVSFESFRGPFFAHYLR